MMQKGKNITFQPVRGMKVLIAGILLGAVLLGGGYFLGRVAPEAVVTAEEMEAVVLDSQIMKAGELVTVSYIYTEMGQYESSKEFYGTKLPLTTSRFMLTYDGVMKAGIDLGKVSVKADSLTKTVAVQVPQAEVLAHGMDENSVQIYDEKHSVFNKLTLEDYTRFFADQEKAVETKAREKGLLSEAQTEAEVQLRNLLEPIIRSAGGEDWSREFQLARQ